MPVPYQKRFKIFPFSVTDREIVTLNEERHREIETQLKKDRMNFELNNIEYQTVDIEIGNYEFQDLYIQPIGEHLLMVVTSDGVAEESDLENEDDFSNTKFSLERFFIKFWNYLKAIFLNQPCPK